MKKRSIASNRISNPLFLVFAALVIVGLLAGGSYAGMGDYGPGPGMSGGMAKVTGPRDMRPGMAGHGREGRPPEMMDCGPDMWMSIMSLGLDAKQKTGIEQIRSRTMKEIIRKRADERIAEIDLRELLEKEHVDMKAVGAKLRQKEALRTEIQLSLIKAKVDALAKLTPRQRKRLRDDSDSCLSIGRRDRRGGPMHGDMRMPPPERHFQ